MESIGTEVGQKMRSAIKAKLMELGCYVDDELPDYIMVMVANKRSRSQMEDDLQLFLRSDTQIFVEWLQQVLKKLKEVTITNPEVCGSFRELKRKAAMEIAECVIRKEKRDKKIKPEKKTRSVEIIPEVKSISDEIPVQATKLVEKRNQAMREHNETSKTKVQALRENSETIETSKTKAQALRENNEIMETTKTNASEINANETNVEIVNEDSFDIPSLAEVNQLEDSELDKVANRIKEARNRIVLMKSDSEDEDFINLRADEELMGDDLDKSASTNVEAIPQNEDNNKSTSTKRPISERLGARPTSNIAEKRKITVEDIKEKQPNKIISSVIVKKPENIIRKKESVHKRLGLPSSVVSLSKNDESDEELPKSVKSSVKVKPRRNISGLVQANKNLLLKAVAEAQKSVSQTPIVGREIKKKKTLSKESNKVINNNITKKPTASEDEKLRNIIIEIKSTKLPSENEDSELETEYISSPIRKFDSPKENALNITFEEDLEKFDEDFEVEEPEMEDKVQNQQFIVTLDGLKDQNIFKNEENCQVEVSKPKKAPSPIIFDKKDSPKVEKPQIPEKLPKVQLPLSVKAKERCKYWPNCRLRESCEYIHPSTPCNMFPVCKFGDKCLYIHPKCKFDASCTRKDCPYSHGSNKIPAPKAVRPLASFIVSPEICKFHPNCSNPHCHFFHPSKPCKYGQYCMNRSDCNFSHGKIPNKDKMKWHSNAR